MCLQTEGRPEETEKIQERKEEWMVGGPDGRGVVGTGAQAWPYHSQGE